MANTRTLRKALKILTEGGAAPMIESLKTHAESLYKSSRPWTMGEGIQGVGIGQKVKDCEMLSDIVLKVYVERKLPKTKTTNLVPKTVRVPGIEEPLPTDVEEIGKVEIEPNTGRVRPSIPGFGVGHTKISVGTFGCIVRLDGDSDGLYILSNSHVLADEGVANKGDVIIQPGDYDDGKAPEDVIAKLHSWVPFQFTDTSYPNLVDAAIAKLDKNQKATSAIRKIGVPKGVSKTLRRGMKVQKTGRTTDYTIGEIRDIDYRLALDYKNPNSRRFTKGRVGLRDQVLCTRYTAGGDSGSAVLNTRGKIVGLHFAGSPSSSIFNKIGNVIDLLNISIVTDEI